MAYSHPFALREAELRCEERKSPAYTRIVTMIGMTVAGMAYRERRFTAQDGLNLYFRDSGDPTSAATPVLCLGGFTRNSRDFDLLARRLAAERRVGSLVWGKPMNGNEGSTQPDSDEDMIPDLSRGDWPAKMAKARVRRGRPATANPKISTTIRLSPEVIAHFKAGGPGWQTRINEALHEWIVTHESG